VIHVTGECRLSFEEEMQVLTMCRHYREKLLLVTREVDALRRDQGQMLKKFKNMLEDPTAMLTASGEHAKSLKKWKDRIVRRLRAERLGTGETELVALILAALRGDRLNPEDVLMLQNRERYMDAVEERRSTVVLGLMEMPPASRWMQHTDINALLSSPFDLMQRILGGNAERDSIYDTGPEVPTMRNMPYVMAVEHITEICNDSEMSFNSDGAVSLFIKLYSLFTQSLGVKLPRAVNPVHQHTFATLSLALAGGGRNHGMLQSLLHICRRSRKVCECLPRLDRPRRVVFVRQWKAKLIAVHRKLMALAQQPEIQLATAGEAEAEDAMGIRPDEEEVPVLQSIGDEHGGLCPHLVFAPSLGESEDGQTIRRAEFPLGPPFFRDSRTQGPAMWGTGSHGAAKCCCYRWWWKEHWLGLGWQCCPQGHLWRCPAAHQ